MKLENNQFPLVFIP